MALDPGEFSGVFAYAQDEYNESALEQNLIPERYQSSDASYPIVSHLAPWFVVAGLEMVEVSAKRERERGDARRTIPRSLGSRGSRV